MNLDSFGSGLCFRHVECEGHTFNRGPGWDLAGDIECDNGAANTAVVGLTGEEVRARTVATRPDVTFVKGVILAGIEAYD